MDSVYTGWDIGGAHLKMAVVEPGGQIISARQYPTPLWQGLDTLRTALRTSMQTYPQHSMCHAVTTTAELADIFRDRRQGVQALADCLLNALDSDSIRFYSGGPDWIAPEFAEFHYQRIASANWHATASFIASRVSDGVLLDIGSTTTDITGFCRGMVCNRGYSDFERLACGELVYTGIVRTPVMAVTDTVLLNNKPHPLVAEVFATMADVYRLLGQLDEDDDMLPTADGAGKSRMDSMRRLARMTGQDVSDEAGLQIWQSVASHIAGCQRERIIQALDKVLSGMKTMTGLTIVGAGAGRFLAQAICKSRGLSYIDFADLLCVSESIRPVAARSAPAVAVALLARQSA